jgi:hypothetical protein
LDGEITADTGARTVRIHDGETPGGFPLARADLSNVAPGDLAAAIYGAGISAGGSGGPGSADGGAIDLSQVAPEFWTALFSMYGPAAAHSRLVESQPFNIGNYSYLEYIFGELDGFDPATARIDAALVCQTPQAGYSIGDVVYAFGIGMRANPAPFAFRDPGNGVRIRLFVGGEDFWVSHKDTGIQTTVSHDKWAFKLRAWY